MDSATSPSTLRRMTGCWGVLWRVKYYISEWPTIRESGAYCISFGLMPCSLIVDWCCLLVVDWCSEYLLWNKALLTCFGLMMFLLIKDGFVYWLWNGADSVGYWLMCLLDLDWFTCWALNKMGISCVVCHGIFKWTGFFSHSYPHPMSFCTKVSYRDAESTISMLTPHLQIILHKGPLLSCNIDCSIFTTYLYVILLAGLARSCRIYCLL